MTQRKWLRLIASILVVACIDNRIAAQYSNMDLDSIINLYSFINKSDNHIQNDSLLHSFYEKVMECKAKQVGAIDIVQIGDSHMQAGSFTKPIRIGLQNQLGNGGRGLVFPYQIARTNGPADVVSSSNIKWVARRNAVKSNTLPTGLAGHTIYTPDSSALIKIRVKDTDTSYVPITRVKIFHGSLADSNFAYHLIDTNGVILASPAIVTEQTDTTTTFILQGKHNLFTIGQSKTAANQISSTFFGCVIDYGVPGVLYHTIGVNGAEYRSYLEADKFLSQLADLSPDLVILSLGTNEAFDSKNFSPEAIRKHVQSLTDSIQKLIPHSAILITTLPESLKPYRVKKRTYYKINPNVAIMRNLLVEVALERGLAYWDLYTIMGGVNSMNKWHVAGMTDTKRIHFSNKGYQLQGQLLYQALWESIVSHNLKKTK